MLKFRSIILSTLALFCSTFSHAFEKEITLIDQAGHPICLSIDSSDRFIDVIDDLQRYYAQTDAGASPFNMMVTTGDVVISPQQAGRDYYRKVTAEEKEDITYLITHMANDELWTLKNNRSKMEKIGDRIVHLHPFKFLETICTSDRLIAGAKGIYDRILLGSWVWKEFVDGCVRTLREEHANKNVLPYVGEFAKKIKVDVKFLMPLAQNQKWKEFVTTVVEKVQRTTDADRYRDM